MDTATNGSNESNGLTVDDLCRHFGVSPHQIKDRSPAFGILPMIEQRIRASVRTRVEITRKGLDAVISAEVKGLGLDPDVHSAWKFVAKIADAYEERLVAERIKAIVDGLVSEKPAKTEAPTVSANGCDLYGMPVKAAEPEVCSYSYSTVPCSTPIVTITMPPNLTKEQRDVIIAGIKNQLPANTQLVALVHGVELGRI
jgi:hypothetical protein